MGNPHNIFLNALWGLRHVMHPPPPLRPPWSDNSGEGIRHNRKAEVLVGGGRYCPIRKQVLFNLFKTQVSPKPEFHVFLTQMADSE